MGLASFVVLAGSRLVAAALQETYQKVYDGRLVREKSCVRGNTSTGYIYRMYKYIIPLRYERLKHYNSKCYRTKDDSSGSFYLITVMETLETFGTDQLCGLLLIDNSVGVQLTSILSIGCHSKIFFRDPRCFYPRDPVAREGVPVPKTDWKNLSRSHSDTVLHLYCTSYGQIKFKTHPLSLRPSASKEKGHYNSTTHVIYESFLNSAFSVTTHKHDVFIFLRGHI